MRENKKKIIITLLIIVSMITIFFTFKTFINKPLKDLPEVKLREIKKDKAIAIMVSQDGKKYKEYEGEEWPGTEYKYKEAKCVNNNGKEIKEVITFDEETNTITLESNETLYCTLYFDEKTIINTLRANDPNGVLSKELVGGLYRYQGVGVSPAVDTTHKLVDNNYICFGTNSEDECKNNPDKYMYRIIGVTDKEQLYLIKMKGVEEGENKKFAWNLKYLSPDCDGTACEWPNVDIYIKLNGTASNGNPIFINNPNYEYMQEGNIWFDLIENHNWMYGDIDFNVSTTLLDGETIYGVKNSGLILYDIETGVKPTQTYDPLQKKYVKYQWSKDRKITAKVGLMYVHDYYLAYDNIRNWRDNYDKNNWLLFVNNEDTTGLGSEWLISRRGTGSDGTFWAWNVDATGYQGNYYINSNSRAVRPTFYLSSTINVNGGTGSRSNPYMIVPKNEEGNYYYDYEYTGNVQTFTVPEDGTYKIELWGASGGTASSYVPGKGAYTKGEIKLKKDEKLYIYIGEEGKSGLVSYLPTFNGGGGTGFRSSSGSSMGGTGGGATDVRLDKGTWDNFASLKSRIMVAAGGGAAGSRGGNNGDGNGGAGGALVGIEGQAINNTGMYYGYGIAYGGTQTSAGKTTWINGTTTTLPENYNPDIIVGGFGYAGIIWGTDCYVDCQPRNNLNWIQFGSQTGGGGGYYGGASTLHAGAAGGSSYISGYDGCKAIAKESTENNITHLDISEHYSGKVFTNSQMIAGNQSMPNYKGGTMTGNSGNGFARITKID